MMKLSALIGDSICALIVGVNDIYSYAINLSFMEFNISNIDLRRYGVMSILI